MLERKASFAQRLDRQNLREISVRRRAKWRYLSVVDG
jgi:hypothetical protein